MRTDHFKRTLNGLNCADVSLNNIHLIISKLFDFVSIILNLPVNTAFQSVHNFADKIQCHLLVDIMVQRINISSMKRYMPHRDTLAWMLGLLVRTTHTYNKISKEIQ
ncbi:hypothetical protein LSH36_40g11022 [Paralvinella palmiformis]|uniref:Uncharacterized protein n=1 Tax=Paralvinella palmiformis TaxID=53620 RepID=A0AAD9K8B7_9ANNE|nr:hypothetical protein LSH36_40g11022 [Paralvinella palmiformis]